MKNYILLILLVSFLQVSYSQCNLNNYFVSSGIGAADVTGQMGQFVKTGVGFNLGFGKEMNQHLSVSVQNNLVIASQATQLIENRDIKWILRDGDYNLNLTVLKVQYKFWDHEFTPFIGLGVGGSFVYDPLLPEFRIGNSSNGLSQTVITLGMAYLFEMGLVYKDFNLTYSYGMNGRTAESNSFNPESENLKVNYHSVSVGYRYMLFTKH